VPVEIAAEAYAEPCTSEREPEFSRCLLEDRLNERPTMPVLVRIDVRRLTTDKRPEPLELSLQLTPCVPAHSARRHGRTSPWEHAASPLPQLDV